MVEKNGVETYDQEKEPNAVIEFLMTYGWAILVVLIAIGALWYFGVLNPLGSKSLDTNDPDYDPYLDCTELKTIELECDDAFCESTTDFTVCDDKNKPYVCTCAKGNELQITYDFNYKK